MTATTRKASPVASTDIGVTYEKISSSSEFGNQATFLKVGNRGLKCYKSEYARNMHYRYQRKLSVIGLAPFVDDCVDVTMPDGSVKYAYWSGLADVAYEVFHNDYSNPKRGADHTDLKDRLEDANYDWCDDHDGNWGYVNGRAVLIDCAGY